VTATGGDIAAGIGGGYSEAGGTIIIGSNATVTAIGGKGDEDGFAGAGIGGGADAAGGTIKINSGTVTAIGVLGSAGIGGGRNGAGSIIEITGGSVKATAGTGAEDIGGGADAADSGSLTDDHGAPVYKVVIPGAADGVRLATIDMPLAGGGSYAYSGYGHPSDTNLYFYLPNGGYAFDVMVSEIGSAEYAARVKNTATTAGPAETFPPYIASVASDGESLVIGIFPSNTVSEVLGADMALMNGDWDWNPVVYTTDPDGSVCIAVANAWPIIRVKLLR